MKFAKPCSTSMTRSKEELTFLPAALEIVETPPPAAAGALSTIIIALFCLAAAWAALGKIDIVASAGKDHSERPHQDYSAV
jgi:hemolysin D